MGYLPGADKVYVILSATENFNPDIVRSAIGYLERDLTAELPAEVPADAARLEPYAGLYQGFPSRQPVMALLESLSFQAVSLVDGRLVIAGEPRALTAEGLLRRIDRPYATHALATDEAGVRFIISSLGALRQVPLWEIGLKGLYGALAAAFILGTLVYLLVWLIGWPLGRLKERGGPWPRLVALIAVAVPVAALAVVGVAGSGESWVVIERLGNPTPIAQTVFGLTIAWPIAALAALVTGLFARGLGALQRAYVIGAGAILLVGALYAAQYGWIGLRPWAY
jgi:hypothetical protein